jgi:drug/metabolite transporter (DMT)-like permease
MVPLLSALCAGTLNAVPARTWAACLIAFAGVVVMGADDDDPVGHRCSLDWSHASGGGDALIVLAALAYTMHVVRLGAFAPRTDPLRLAAAKASTEAMLSVTLCAWLACVGNGPSSSELPTFVSGMGGSVAEYFSTMTTKFAGGAGLLETTRDDGSFGASIGAILWTGWVTCAYTIYAQSYGQRKVGPSDSNLIYTTQPLFSSLFAYLLLGETLGPYGYAGAALIGVSLWLVSK